MTDENAPVRKHHATAKEHLAGLAGAAAWRKELVAKHLLDSQQPIRSEPKGEAEK